MALDAGLLGTMAKIQVNQPVVNCEVGMHMA